MKKILLSLLVIAVVSIGMFGATRAYFSDTETSEDNTFIAGTLDLKVDDVDDPEIIHIEVNNIEPGWGDYYSWVLKNTGNVEGQPTITIGDVDNYENDCTEPEGNIDGTCGDPGFDEGELGSKLYMRLQWSDDGGSTWNQLRCNGNWGDHHLNTCENITVGLGDYIGVGPNIDTVLPTLGENDTVEFRLHPWWHHTSTDNIAQTDSAGFDIEFSLDQI